MWCPIDRYIGHRPQETFDSKTLDKVHYARPTANERPRFEPRTRWPRGSPRVAPQVGVDGDPGDPIIFEIDRLDGRRHLPMIRVGPAV
jgi:hypothetical protein